jgi:pilus assembly protein TadC
MNSNAVVALVFISTSIAAVTAVVPVPSRARRRVQSLGVSRTDRPRPLSVWEAVDFVGHRLRRWFRRPSDVAADRRAGLALLFGGSVALVHPVLGLFTGGLPFAIHFWQRHRRRRAADAAFVAELPDVVDLFRVAAGAGLTVHHAIEAVRGVSAGSVSQALGAVHRRVSFGERLADALPELVDDLGEPMRPLVAALVSAERDGAPLRVPLEQAATISRDVRRRRAEETARRVPVQLLFPLVACVLPAFALLTVVPLLAGTLRTLSL